MSRKTRQQISALNISICSKIRDKKDVLFGKLSATLTAFDKEREWKAILKYGKSIGLFKESQDWHYPRKVFCQWKLRTLEKKDRKNQTRGGAPQKMTKLDSLILDIIENESPIIDSLGLPESMDAEVDPAQLDSDGYETPTHAASPVIPKATEIEEIVGTSGKHQNLATAKRKLVELQIEVLELEKRKKMIEIFELELRLRIPHNSDHLQQLGVSQVLRL